MFVHGLGCDQTMWQFVTPAFEEKFKIVLFDLPGCGKSDCPSFDKSEYTSLEKFAGDVLAIAKELSLRDIIFVGHSVSCMIGMLAAIEAPHLFRKIVMVGPSPCYINHPGYKGGFEKAEVDALLQKLKENLDEWTDTFAPVIMANPERPSLTDVLKRSFKSANHDMLYNLAEATFLSDLRNKLPYLKTPTFIMQSQRDVIAPLEVGMYMNKNIEGSQIAFMKATGHCAHMSEPQETTDLMKRYLSE